MIDFLSIFESPLSWLSALAFLVIILLIYNNEKYSRYSNIVGLSSMLVLTVLIAIEGTWPISLHHTLPFIILSFPFLFTLASTAINDIIFSFSKTKPTANSQLSILNCQLKKILCHTGAFIALFAMFFGAPDLQKGQVIIYREGTSRIAYTEDHKPMALPFELQLNNFKIDYYEDNVSPKQYTSTFTLASITHPDEQAVLTTSVNHPAYYKGYRFYQDSYDRAEQRFSVIKIVRDPWYPIVLIGFVLLALGSVLSIAKSWQLSRLLPVVVILTAFFVFITIRKINFGHLMPALRSYWFVPHLIIYMVAYALMAISLFIHAANYLRKHFARQMVNRQSSIVNCQLEKSLFSTSSSLLIIGMLCGAVWAKQAWGDYWTWDAKENWAAVTWLLSVAATHAELFSKKTTILRIFFMILSFIAIQITWYGVNHLPSANRSLHTYTRK